MKFTIKREEFLKALLNSSRIIGNSSTDPILSTLKIEVFEDKLEVTGSNGELSIKSIVPRFINDKEVIRDIKTGGILVTAKTLVDVIRNLDDEEISFPVEDNTLVRIENSRSTYSINAIRVEEYRDIDFEEEGISLTLNAQEFLNCISQTTFSASTKETRALLTCLNIESSGSKIIFTATDGARLAKSEINYSNELPRFSVNIPAKTIFEATRTLVGEGEVTLFISDKKVLLKTDSCLISFTIILGDYPNTRNIIPHNFFYKLEVQTAEFLKILTRIVIFASERANIIKLTMTENEVTVSCKSQLLGEAKESLTLFQYTGERLEISFNVKYVSDAVRALKNDTIVLSFMGEMKPFTIKAKNSEQCIQLITPVRTY